MECCCEMLSSSFPVLFVHTLRYRLLEFFMSRSRSLSCVILSDSYWFPCFFFSSSVFYPCFERVQKDREEGGGVAFLGFQHLQQRSGAVLLGYGVDLVRWCLRSIPPKAQEFSDRSKRRSSLLRNGVGWRWQLSFILGFQCATLVCEGGNVGCG